MTIECLRCGGIYCYYRDIALVNKSQIIKEYQCNQCKDSITISAAVVESADTTDLKSV